jgi:hypothetical protein
MGASLKVGFVLFSRDRHPGYAGPQRSGAAADAKRAAAYHFQQLGELAQLLDEGVDLRLTRGEFHHEPFHCRVEHATAAPDHRTAHRIGVGGIDAQLQEHQLALQVHPAGHVQNVHDIHELVQLVDDLLDHRIRAGCDQGQARDSGVIGRGYREGLDVVAAGRKQARHPGQGAGFVLQQDGNDVAHGGGRSLWAARFAKGGENKGSAQVCTTETSC